jgi:hypothetical protein
MVEFNRKEMLKLENIKVIAKKHNIELKINCHSISYITHLGKVHSLDKFNSKRKKLFKKKKANGNSMTFEPDFAEENESVVTFDHEEDLMETEGNDVEVNATSISRNIAEENESEDTLDEEDLMETEGDSMSVEKNVEEENESDDTLDNEVDLIETEGNDVVKEVNVTDSIIVAKENADDITLDHEEDLMVEKNVEEENESDETLDNEEDLMETKGDESDDTLDNEVDLIETEGNDVVKDVNVTDSIIVANENADDVTLDNEEEKECNDHSYNDNDMELEENDPCNEVDISEVNATGSKVNMNGIAMNNDSIMSNNKEDLSQRKLLKLKSALLKTCKPNYMIIDEKISPEKNYEDLLLNCINLEFDLNKRNYSLLCQYYRIGYFLFEILKKFRSANIKSYHSEKSLITGIIKGCGIANLFCISNRKYKHARKKSVKFYNMALRIYRIYSHFPNPKYQIARTSGGVFVNNFLEIGSSNCFDQFLIQISEEIEKHYNDYCENNANFNDDSDFILQLITEDLIADIKNYIKFPDSPLKSIVELDSLGLVGSTLFDKLVSEGKIDTTNTNFKKFATL